MAAILSNREASLVYFPLIMLIRPAAALYMKDKEKNGGYLFLLQLRLTHNPSISHSAIYLKIETHKGMEKHVHKSVIVRKHNQKVYS